MHLPCPSNNQFGNCIEKAFGPNKPMSKAQTLCIYKIIKVIVVHKDKNLTLAVFQVILPSLKCFNND